jgi:hypothetical protein
MSRVFLPLAVLTCFFQPHSVSFAQSFPGGPHGGRTEMAALLGPKAILDRSSSPLYFELVQKGGVLAIYPLEKTPGGEEFRSLSVSRDLGAISVHVTSPGEPVPIVVLSRVKGDHVEARLDPIQAQRLELKKGSPLVIKVVALRSGSSMGATFHTEKETLLGE